MSHTTTFKIKKGLQVIKDACKPFWLYGGGNGFQLLNSDGGLFNRKNFREKKDGRRRHYRIGPLGFVGK